MLDAASERILAQIAAAERARDRRFADALARGVSAGFWCGVERRDLLPPLTLLALTAGVVFGWMPLAVTAGVGYLVFSRRSSGRSRRCRGFGPYR